MARTLTGVEKAAVLLLALGADLSSQVLRQNFYDEDIERITYTISNMGRVSPETRDNILTEFEDLYQAKQYILQGGIKYAKELLEKTVGPNRASEIIKKLTSTSKILPFGALRKTEPRYLANFIRDEHPQTIAMILAYLEPNQASACLSMLPQEIRADVARRIALMDKTSPEVVQDVEKILERKMAALVQQESYTVGGLQALVKILNQADRATEKKILEELEYDDPGLAEEVRQQMFIFEDIVKLDDISIQRILREVDNKVLALALRGANESVRERIYKNQSQRASQMLKEEIEFMGPVRLREVEEAQQRIVKIIRSLDEAGEIVISRGGEDALVI